MMLNWVSSEEINGSFHSGLLLIQDVDGRDLFMKEETDGIGLSVTYEGSKQYTIGDISLNGVVVLM